MHSSLSRDLLIELLASREPLDIEGTHGRRVDSARASTFSDPIKQRCSIVLPIIADDDLIGAIVLGPKRSGDPFYPLDVDLLSTLANQAGVAIKNAQLYEQVVLINEHLQNIVATIESGVVAVSQAGHITMFNRAAAEFTGLAADALVGRPVAALPGVLAEPLHATLADGQQRVVPDIELPRAATPALPIICSTSPLRAPTGELLGAVAVFSDVTLLKELETERRRAERLAYFEALAAGIAHEIKNPLVAIKTFVQLLPRRLHEEGFRESFGRIASREIERMEHLLERLRSLAKPGGRPRRVLDLRAPIDEALELLQPRLEERRITVQWAAGPTPVAVLGDPSELEQLFLNLLTNAMEAMDPGGTIVVRLTAVDGRLTVEVEDSGPGIDEELLGRIFDPFVTTKLHGSGLGLTICTSIADAHHARLQAANKSGARGAVFTIEFPTETLVQASANA
jgi:PAS domain S-box-containing protein